MDFLNQILAYVNNSSNPELYYIAALIALIFIFILAEKIFKIISLVCLVLFFMFGINILQNQELQGAVKSVVSSVEGGKVTSASSSGESSSSGSSSHASSGSGNGSYITGNARNTNNSSSNSSSNSNSNSNAASSSSLQQIMSVLSKFSSGN